MSESVQFWLDNKMSAGIKVAAIGDQVLVIYRDKFYVVEHGAAHMRGGKPLHFSKSSMPAIWKKALKGGVPSPDAVVPPPEEVLPIVTSTRNKRTTPEERRSSSPVHMAVQKPHAQSPAPAQATRGVMSPKGVKKMDTKPVTQTTVATNCPHCNHKHEIPLEKGKNGKPFFTTCTRCKNEFAVRFVPVTVFQAQVARFR